MSSSATYFINCLMLWLSMANAVAKCQSILSSVMNHDMVVCISRVLFHLPRSLYCDVLPLNPAMYVDWLLEAVQRLLDVHRNNNNFRPCNKIYQHNVSQIPPLNLTRAQIS